MKKSLCVASLVAAVACIGRDARADDEPPPPEKHFVRASLELGGIVAVGLVDYLLNTAVRGGSLRPGDLKWDLRYDPELFRGKFTGASYSWDTNKFGTNFASHPFAGWLYFGAARSNHLSFLESMLFSAGASGVWEYFGEIREINSVNDMIVTPLSGTVLGEATMELASFFDRSEPRFGYRALSLFLAPWKAINELDEPGEPRDPHPDSRGFPRDRSHRFRFDAVAGITRQTASYADMGGSLSLEVERNHEGAFSDGHGASLGVDVVLSDGNLVDARLTSRIVPMGWTSGGALLGLRMSFDYETHDWDRDRHRPVDIDCLVSPLGFVAEYRRSWRGLRARTSVEVGGALAGVSPYAFADFVRARTATGLPTVTREQGYDYSLAVMAQPSVMLGWRTLEWESSVRLDSFRGVLAMDEDPASVDRSLTITDRRIRLASSLAWEPRPARVALSVRHGIRSGDIGTIHASRSESTVGLALGVVF